MWHVFQLLIIGAIVWAADQWIGLVNGLLTLVIVAFAVGVALLATKLIRAALDALARSGRFGERSE
jgi:UPF0716 family protein affecting phage T7 exclusion